LVAGRSIRVIRALITLDFGNLIAILAGNEMLDPGPP